jgi:hypothetical protein
MITTDEKRRLQSIFARFGLSRNVRNKAVAAVSEWVAEREPSRTIESSAAAKELVAALRAAKARLMDSKEATP